MINKEKKARAFRRRMALITEDEEKVFRAAKDRALMEVKEVLAPLIAECSKEALNLALEKTEKSENKYISIIREWISEDLEERERKAFNAIIEKITGMFRAFDFD